MNIITLPFRIVFKLIVGIIVIILILAIIGNSVKKPPITRQLNVSQPGISKKIVIMPKVSKHATCGEIFANPDFVLTSKATGNKCIDQYINGTIKNISNKNYSYSEVEINLYYVNKNQVCSALDSITNFQSGTTWTFKAHYVNDSARSYRIINILGR